jgi:multidrug efflux system membrane fusion protein
MVRNRPSPGQGPCRRGYTICLVLLAATSLSSCSRTSIKEDVPPTPRSVRFTRVAPSPDRRVRTFSGLAKAMVESQLSFRVAGSVLRVPASVGDTVRRGQLIAELDPNDFQLQVEDARAAVAQAQAQERNARATFGRVRALYESKNASLEEYDAARAAAESAAAQVRSVEKRLELARSQLSYTRLLAPSDAAIAAVNVQVNENVAPGQSVVLVTSRSALQVEVDIPEGAISEIRRGDPVSVVFSSVPGERFAAEVDEVGVAPAEFSTTYPVTVQLTQSHAAVRPGMAAEVEFLLGAEKNEGRTRVPPEAVAEDREGRFVYVIESTGGDRARVHRRRVEVGEIGAEGIAILSGLAEGDLIVTAGISRLKDGEEVLLLSSEID